MSEHVDVPCLKNAFGRYRLVRRLEASEVGEAHIAKLVGIAGFEKQVALWCVDEMRMRDSSRADAVMLEAKRGASLSHTNIAQVLDVGVVDGTCFVATEYVSGRTLEQVLRLQGSLPWPLAVYIAGEVAAALCYAHGRRNPSGELLRLVHRCLAPNRITLSTAGDVKVTGFGTSWACPRPDEYRSPEEARGERVDGRADVFALGAILCKCLPQAGVPQALRDVIGRTLQPYPERRPTATEFRLELAQVLHATESPIAPRDLVELAVGMAPRIPTPRVGSLVDAIDRIETALDSTSFDSVTDTREALELYEQFGRLCLAARVGERGVTHMARALDLADGLGCDSYAARFCTLRGQLLAQANRTDESLDWLERAATFCR